MGNYDLESLALPTLSGTSLRIFAALLRMPLLGKPLLAKLITDAGIPKLLDARLDLPPTFLPLVSDRESATHGFTHRALSNSTGMPSIRDYQHAYESGTTTPLEVAEATISAIATSNSGARSLRAIINCHPDDVRRQAEESTRRYSDGKPRSPFEGVPIAIKDELDMVPYPTTVGTAFLGSSPATEDATVVARLRNAGALLIGKTNMYEIGISPEGHNLHHGTVRNPYDLAHQTGGSSSGSGAAVSAGLCPMAIGADGGGSIRVPAAMCGVVGLKATYGRISESGAAPLCWSLAHLGPISATTEDAALTYELIAGPDPKDPSTLRQPSATLGDWAIDDLEGVTLGVYRSWFEHATPPIVRACDEMLDKLRHAGARIEEIEIPNLDLMRIAQAVTILAEMATAMEPHSKHLTRHAPAVQINLLAGREFKARHYVLAQKVRTLALQTMARSFERVDAIVTPTTAITAPTIPEKSVTTGWSNINSVTEIMRYVFLGNLTGNPAISFPVGYDPGGLPIGMQAMAKHWNEHVLLRLSWVAEQNFQRRLPGTFFRSLAAP